MNNTKNTSNDTILKFGIFGVTLIVVIAIIGLSGGLQAKLVSPGGGDGNSVPTIPTFDISCDSVHIVLDDPDLTNQYHYRASVFFDEKNEATRIGAFGRNDFTIDQNNTTAPFPTEGVHTVIVMAKDIDSEGNTVAWISGFPTDPNTTYNVAYKKTFDFGTCGGGGNPNILDSTACTYTGALNCDNGVICDDTGCECDPDGGGNPGGGTEPDYFIENFQEPINDDLEISMNNVIYNDPIGYRSCGLNYSNHKSDAPGLFNTLSINAEGDTLYTSEYMGGSSFKLGNDFMSLESEKVYDFRGGVCVYSHIFDGTSANENPNYPCDPSSQYYSEPTMDCGTQRIHHGNVLGLDTFVMQGRRVSGHPTILFKGEGASFGPFSDFRKKNPFPGWWGDDISVAKTGGGQAIVGSGTSALSGEYFFLTIGRNGTLYGILKTSDTSAGIMDLSDPANPTLVANVDPNTGLGKYVEHYFQNRTPGSDDLIDVTSAVGGVLTSGGKVNPTPLLVYGYLENGTITVYDITNPTEEKELATFQNQGVVSTSSGFFDVMRVEDRLYYAANDGIYVYDIGSSTKFTKVIARTISHSNARITRDHMLFFQTGEKLSVWNLKTGRRVLQNVDIPDAYGEFGYKMVKREIQDWEVTRHDDAYYVYLMRGMTGGGLGPNYIQAVKIEKEGTSTYQNLSCVPNCGSNPTCGQPDGCGFYCDSTIGDDGYLDNTFICGNDYLECLPTGQGDGAIYTGQPSCQCELHENQNDQCSVNGADDYCEYKRATSGPWFDGIGYGWRVWEYTCEGVNDQCSQMNKENTIQPWEPSSCTKLD